MAVFNSMFQFVDLHLNQDLPSKYKLVYEHDNGGDDEDVVFMTSLVNPVVEADELLIVYSQQELDEEDQDDRASCLLVTDDTIELAYLMVGDGYRGQVIYSAYVKVNNKWYELDVVSEGMAYELSDNDEMMATAVDSYTTMADVTPE